MKNFLLAVLIPLVIHANAQNQNAKATSTSSSNFKEPLQKTFNTFDSSKDFNLKTNLSNRLGLIAMKWPNEWLTHYYLSYSKAILSSLEKDDDKRDDYLDEADKEHAKAVNLLGKENDETYVLAALIDNWRIGVSPMARGSKYGSMFDENMEAAKKINPNNPRIYYLQGFAKYEMPKFVGGGVDAALPFLKKANSLYQNETDTNIAKPYWGKKETAYYLSRSKTNQ